MVDDGHSRDQFREPDVTSIKVNTYIDQAAVRAKMTRAADPVMRVKAEEAGKEMVRIANALMAGQFNLYRPHERRRYPGSRRAATALTHVVSGSNSEYTVGYKVLGGDKVFKRILGMNYGTGDGHWIRPSGNWELRGAGIFSRASRTQGVTRRSTQPLLAWVDEDSGEDVITTEVWHPGTARTGFLQEARDAVVAQLR